MEIRTINQGNLATISKAVKEILIETEIPVTDVGMVEENGIITVLILTPIDNFRTKFVAEEIIGLNLVEVVEGIVTPILSSISKSSE